LFFELGLSLSLLAVLVAFNWSSNERTASLLIADDRGIIEEEEQIPVTQPELPLPEIPKIQQIPDIIDIVDDEVDISFDFTEKEGKDDIFKDLIYIGKKTPIKDEPEIIDIFPFVSVEVKPMFQGKDAGEFVKWIYAQLAGKYPQAAIENNIQGVVRVSFTVNVDGSLSDIKSLRKIDPILEDCVIELVKKSPKWTPGRQQNKPVKVTYQVPVVFKLQ
jgi:protein TonB